MIREVQPDDGAVLVFTAESHDDWLDLCRLDAEIGNAFETCGDGWPSETWLNQAKRSLTVRIAND